MKGSIRKQSQKTLSDQVSRAIQVLPGISQHVCSGDVLNGSLKRQTECFLFRSVKVLMNVVASEIKASVQDTITLSLVPFMNLKNPQTRDVSRATKLSSSQ